MLQKTLGQCQFGFQSSLEAWPENQDAIFGLREAIEIVAEVELISGDPKIAVRMLREVESPCADLVAKARAAARAITQADEDLAELEQQMDKELGKGVRLFLLIVFGFGWTWIEVWAYWAGTSSHASHRIMIATSLIYLVVIAILAFLVRHTLMKTNVNRQFSAALFVVLINQIMASMAGASLGLSSEQVFAIWMLIWTVALMMAAVTIERRIWPSTLAVSACFLVTSLSMDLRLYAMLGFTLVLIANAMVIWMPGTQARDSQGL